MTFSIRLAARPASMLKFRAPAFAAQRAGFRAFAPRMAGKEDALHEEGRAEKAEAHKQDQLQKQKAGKNEWESELASNSEEAVEQVKADRGEGAAGEAAKANDIGKLQEATKHHAEEKSK